MKTWLMTKAKDDGLDAEHVWRFEALKGQEDHDAAHPHFVCVDCGNVSCIDELKLTASSKRLSESFGEVTEILLRGHCNDCT